MAKKSTQQSTTNQTQNVVSTPTNPAWVTGGLESLGGTLQSLGAADPYSFVAGPDALQTQAATAAKGLGSSPYFDMAGDAFTKLLNQSPNATSADQFGGAKLGTAPQYGGTRVGPASTYAGAKVGPAATYGGTQTGPAASYGGTQVGSAATYGGTTIDPTQLVGEFDKVKGESLLDNLGAYMSPYTKEVVDASLADYDYGAGQNEGQAKLDLAGDSTFGGSGGSIGLAALRADQARGRGTLSAGLRDQAFTTGASLSGQDADRRQGATIANLTAEIQRRLANTSAENNRSIQQAGLTQQTGIANTGFQNEAQRLQSQLDQETGLTNTGAENNRRLMQSQLDQQTGTFNVGEQNQAQRLQSELEQQAGLANTGFQNDAQKLQSQLDQETGLSNNGVLADFLKSQGLLDEQTGTFNTGEQNRINIANLGSADEASQRGIGAATGLGLLGQAQGDDARKTIDTQSQLGQILQALTQAKTGAPFSQASLLASLWGGLPLDLLHGGTTNATTNGTATGKSTDVGIGGEDLAKIAAAAIMASDRRLKHGVERIGEEPNGLGVYEFSYHGSADRYVGYMADEVAKVRPEAVVTMPNGYLAVNYGAL